MDQQQQPNLCPVTLKPLPSNNPQDVAVLQKCNHRVTLIPFVRHLQENSNFNIGIQIECPVCQESITGVVDASVNSSISKSSVYFKYGKLNYSLGCCKEGEILQKRIATVLGTREDCLKILQKGKTIFPSSSLTPAEVSSLLNDVSSEINHTFKPKLTVMATRNDQALSDDRKRGSDFSLANRVYRLVSSFLNGVFSVLVGALWFFKSLFYLPKVMTGSREHDE